MKQQIRNNTNNEMKSILKDLCLYHYGYEACCEDTAWGPGIKDHYKIHIILSGKGTYSYNGITYTLSKGMAFLTEPGVLTAYKADIDDPWVYNWIAFDGNIVESILMKSGFGFDNPILELSEMALLDLEKDFQLQLNQKSMKENNVMLEMSFLYRILGYFIEDSRQIGLKPSVKESYIEQAELYIHSNYSSPISCIDIADHIGIHRKYLTRLFKEYVHQSPQEYLINHRMQQAKTYLQNTALSINEISNSVGYINQLTFSKAFKRHTGYSPSEFRHIS